jgi:hypothetical protein
MAMKAIRMPIGSVRIATSAERACSRKTTHTQGYDQAFLEQLPFRFSIAR